MKDSRRQGMEVTRKAGAGITADAKKTGLKGFFFYFSIKKGL